MMAAGLFAHTIFLANQLFLDKAYGNVPVLSNWFQWTVVGAWGLAVACQLLLIRYPSNAITLFIIPLILGLIGLAEVLRSQQPFQATPMGTDWPAVHGFSLLISTTFIGLGLAFGTMYLLQSYRLKTRKTFKSKFRLPALEFLRTVNRISLFGTCLSLAIGLLSGIVMNRGSAGTVHWLSGSVLFSLALFAWSAMAAGLELRTQGSLGGRRSAYLAIGNFIFLILALAFVLLSAHGRMIPGEANRDTPNADVTRIEDFGGYA